MYTFAFVFLKGSVIRATFSFNLPRNIVALQVETLSCACYRVRDQLVLRQNLPNPAHLIGQSFVNKDGDCSILSFFLSISFLCLPLSVWGFCSVERIKGLENEIEKFTCDIGFPGEGRFSLVN